eukprot:3719425-Karenia_brevis.AAC.1
MHMSQERLARRATEWRDSVWWQTEQNLGPLQTRRPKRTRWFRWEDELKRYAGHVGWPSWQVAALDVNTWKEHAGAFSKFIWQ